MTENHETKLRWEENQKHLNALPHRIPLPHSTPLYCRRGRGRSPTLQEIYKTIFASGIFSAIGRVMGLLRSFDRGIVGRLCGDRFLSIRDNIGFVV